MSDDSEPQPGSGLRRFSARLTADDDGRRLDAVLATRLGQALSKAEVRRLIMAGAVRVNGIVLRRPGRPLATGQRLDVRLQLDLLRRGDPTRAAPFRLTPESVLYEDDALLAVDKPPGLPIHETLDPSRAHLFGIVRAFLTERGGGRPAGERDGTPYLGLHQRLDRDTSGVVLFTKDRAANPALAMLFARHEVLKTYHALTRRSPRLPSREWSLKTRLARTGRRRGARMAAAASGGVLAETRFRRLEVLDHALLIEARPVTGRTHQIRVQLADSQLPILGDVDYGPAGRGAPAARLMLHALRLAFRHPLTGAPLEVVSRYPADFQRTLDTLRGGARLL